VLPLGLRLRRLLFAGIEGWLNGAWELEPRTHTKSHEENKSTKGGTVSEYSRDFVCFVVRLKTETTKHAKEHETRKRHERRRLKTEGLPSQSMRLEPFPEPLFSTGASLPRHSSS
jgi:hypothetical protein